MQIVALFGAAGKVGSCIPNKLHHTSDYRVLYVERSDAGMARLRGHGLTPAACDDAIEVANIEVFAIPGAAIGPWPRLASRA